MKNKIVQSVWVFGVFTIALLNGGIAYSAVKVGLVLDRGGKDDQSFNSSAYRGLKKAEAELKAEVKTVEAPDDNSFEALQRAFAEKKMDLIIAVGFSQKDAVIKTAKRFPEQKFVLIDADAGLSNVQSAMFEEHEGSFLAGVAAAKHSKTKVIGFIGGMDIPLVKRFLLGYESGAKAVDPSIKVLSNTIGITGEAWANPAKAKELTLAQIQQKADVIYHVSGNSGSGVFDACAQKKVLAIGVDSNQNRLRPGTILTSMMKNIDRVVFDAIKSVQDKKFQGGLVRYGLKSGGVELAFDEHNKPIFDTSAKKLIEEYQAKIIAGKLSVPDYYVTSKRK